MIELENFTNYEVDKSFLKKIVKSVLKKEGEEEFHMSVNFVDSSEIRKINKEYRKKDEATDVLSFDWQDGFGEILISPDQLDEENFEEETARVLIHGVLHVLGYEHSKKDGKKMKEKENGYLLEAFKK